MNKLFDKEAAMRGEPVERRDINGDWCTLTYMAGPDVRGFYVFKMPDGGFILSGDSMLRMVSHAVLSDKGDGDE